MSKKGEGEALEGEKEEAGVWSKQLKTVSAEDAEYTVRADRVGTRERIKTCNILQVKNRYSKLFWTLFFILRSLLLLWWRMCWPDVKHWKVSCLLLEYSVLISGIERFEKSSFILWESVNLFVLWFSFGFPQNSSGLLPGENGSNDGATPIVLLFLFLDSAFIYLKLFTE